MTDAEKSARNKRNLVIAAALVGFVLIVFAISLMQMKAHTP
jgi:hypothetical protein